MGSLKYALLSFGSLASAHSLHQKRATVPVDGTIWTSCVTPGVVALTFDDGPFQYTQSIVDQLTAAGHRATFFQNGQNYGSIYDFSETLKSMIAGGHQVASHTWSHADLATLTADEIKSQMGELEAAHLAIIGKAPTYMRPPYLSLNELAISTLTSLGYKIVSVDIDTQDFAEAPLGRIDLSIEWYKGNQTNGGTLSLNHDPIQATADTFVPAIIAYLNSKGLKSVTAGECLGDDPANWYRGGSPSVSSSAGPSSSTPAGSTSSAPGGSASSSAPSSPTGSGSPPKGPGSGGYSGTGAGLGSGPKSGGDTEPGHGDHAGHNALPPHGGGSGKVNSGHHSASGGSGYVSSNSSSASYPPSNSTGSGPNPSYYYNGASGLGYSAVVIGAAAFALLL